MLFRLRQTDGQHYFSGNWIGPDGRSAQIASADITMTPTASTEIERPQGADRMAHRDSRARIEHRDHAAECAELDGDELSLLGGADQF